MEKGPQMPSSTLEQQVAKKRETIETTIGLFESFQVKFESETLVKPEILSELRALANFAIKNLKSESLSQRDASGDSKSVVVEAIVKKFTEYGNCLKSKDAEEDTAFFRQTIRSYFTGEGYDIHRNLVAGMANHMSEEEQKEAEII